MNAPSDYAMEALFRATCPGDKCFSPKCVTSNPNCRTEHSFVSRLTAAGYTIIRSDELERLRAKVTDAQVFVDVAANRMSREEFGEYWKDVRAALGDLKP